MDHDETDLPAFLDRSSTHYRSEWLNQQGAIQRVHSNTHSQSMRNEARSAMCLLSLTQLHAIGLSESGHDSATEVFSVSTMRVYDRENKDCTYGTIACTQLLVVWTGLVEAIVAGRFTIDPQLSRL